jgi:hypothetical protein
VRDASMPLNGPNSPDVATGKVYRSTVFLRVQWMWLSLPVAVWVISLHRLDGDDMEKSESLRAFAEGQRSAAIVHFATGQRDDMGSRGKAGLVEHWIHDGG